MEITRSPVRIDTGRPSGIMRWYQNVGSFPVLVTQIAGTESPVVSAFDNANWRVFPGKFLGVMPGAGRSFWAVVPGGSGPTTLTDFDSMRPPGSATSTGSGGGGGGGGADMPRVSITSGTVVPSDAAGIDGDVFLLENSQGHATAVYKRAGSAWLKIADIASAAEATEAQALAGTDADSRMSPRRVKQAIDALPSKAKVRFSASLSTTPPSDEGGEFVMYNGAPSDTTDVGQNIPVSNITYIRMSESQAPFGSNVSLPDTDVDAVNLVPFIDRAIESESAIILSISGNTIGGNTDLEAPTAVYVTDITRGGVPGSDPNPPYIQLTGLTWGKAIRTPDQGSISIDVEMRLASPIVAGKVSGLPTIPARSGAFTTALENKLNAAFDAAFDEQIGRTFVTNMTGNTEGEAVLSEPTGISQDREIAVDFKDADGTDRETWLGTIGPGDWVYVTRISQGVSTLLFQVEAAKNDSVNTARILQWTHANAIQVGSWPSDATLTGDAKFFFASTDFTRHLLTDLSNLATIAASAKPKLRDAVEDVINAAFRDEVQLANEEYDLAANQTRKASVGAADNQYSFNATPLLGGVAVGLSWKLPAADYAKVLERWATYNWIELGTGTYRITGSVNEVGNRVLQATVQLVEGTNPAVDNSAAAKIYGNDVHRGELTSASFSAEVGTISHKYLRTTGGTKDVVVEMPLTAVPSSTAEKKLVTGGGIRAGLNHQNTQILARPEAVTGVGTDVTFASGKYTVTPAPALSSYAKGIRVTFEAPAANTGATDINVSGLGDRDIVRQEGTQLKAGDIPNGHYAHLLYDGVFFVLLNRYLPDPTHRVGVYRRNSTPLSWAGSATWNNVFELSATPPAGVKLRIRGSLFAARQQGQKNLLMGALRRKVGTGSAAGIYGSGDYTLYGMQAQFSQENQWLDWQVYPMPFEYLMDNPGNGSETVKIQIGLFAGQQANPIIWEAENLYLNRAENLPSQGYPGGETHWTSWAEMTWEAETGSITVTAVTTRDAAS